MSSTFRNQQPAAPVPQPATGHDPGELVIDRGVRSFRGGCTCTRCVLRRAPGKLLDAVFAARLGVALWRSLGR